MSEEVGPSEGWSYYWYYSTSSTFAVSSTPTPFLPLLPSQLLSNLTRSMKESAGE